MNVGHVFAGLVVSDRDRAMSWYEELFGRPADMLPNDAEAVWWLTETASLYIVADSGRAGRGVVTVVVEGIDAHIAELTTRGITPGPIERIGSAGYKSIVIDPDGNAIAFVEIAAPST